MRWMLALLVLLAAGAHAVPARAVLTPVVSTIPLIDQRGERFTLAALRGHPVVMTFAATRCTDACPLANAVFAQLQRRLSAAHRDARLLTVTLDPRYDTPFVMARLATTMGANSGRWILASGAPGDVARFMRAYGVVAQAGKDGVPDVHSTVIYLIDRRGRLAKRLLLSTAAADAVLSALPAL
ncbi:SCO family protein [bacterium]|nr:MAG: SCO family protein [bacterium]